MLVPFARSGKTVYLSSTATSDVSGSLVYGATAPTGFDQTSILQAALNSLVVGGELIWDVAVGWSSPLYVKPGTRIIFPDRSCGGILRNGSNCPMFINAGVASDSSTSKQNTFGKLDPNQSGNAAYRVLDPSYYNDADITIEGGTLIGNKAGQTGYPFTGPNGFASIIKMWGVQNVKLIDIYALSSFGSIAVHFCNASDVYISGEIDNSPILPNQVGGLGSSGGIQINGPATRIVIENVRTHCDDDHIAFNADDSNATAINANYCGGTSVCVPGVNWVQCGDITEFSVKNHRITNGVENVVSHGWVRLLSTAHAIRDGVFDGSFGVTNKYAANIGALSSIQISGTGNIDRVKFINTAVELTNPVLGGSGGVGNGVFDIQTSGGTIAILGRNRGTPPAGAAPDVSLLNPATGTSSLANLLLGGDYYDNGTGGNVAVPQIQANAAVSSIYARTRSSRAGTAVASSVLKTGTGASITLFDFAGDLNLATNVVDHEAGTLTTAILSGSHRNAGGGSPINVATGLTITNVWAKNLAYSSGTVALNSGSGTITNSNAYAETAPAAPHIYDTFTAANGTLLVGRTPSPNTTASATYSVLQGTSSNQTIQSDLASFALPGSNQAVVINSGVSDTTITCNVTFGSSSGCAAVVFFRVTDSNNLYEVVIFANTVDLYRLASGSVASGYPYTASGTLSAGTSYPVTITLSGSSITVQVGSLAAINVTDSSLSTNTKHGFGGSLTTGSDTVTVGNFKVL